MVRRRVDWDEEDVFAQFDRLFEDIRQRMDRMRVESGLTPESMPLSYSYRVVVDQDGQRRVTERFDDGPAASDVHEEDEVLYDVLERDDGISVIAHLPGLSKEDIGVEVAGRSLLLKVDTAQRRLEKEVHLPCPVRASSYKAEYRNGVLEVTLSKAAPKRKRGKALKVE